MEDILATSVLNVLTHTPEIFHTVRPKHDLPPWNCYNSQEPATANVIPVTLERRKTEAKQEASCTGNSKQNLSKPERAKMII